MIEQYILILYSRVHMLLVCLSISSFLLGIDMQIKLAGPQDLESLLCLDYNISFEYFKPLYQKYYSKFTFGKEPDKFLMAELRADRDIFSNAILLQKKTKLLCAYDTVKKEYLGLLLIEQTNEEDLELELLLIDGRHRRRGIGKKLVYAGINSFNGAKRCYVQPFQFGNDQTLAFYEKIGFKFLGLASENKYNSYGEKFSDLYFKYCYKV